MDTLSILYEYLKRSLGNSTVFVNNIAIDQLQSVYDLSVRQGVTAFALDGYVKNQNNKEKLTEKENNIKNLWLGSTYVAINNYNLVNNTSQLLSVCLRREGIKALLLKGIALSRYYESPEFRQFGDIDIYSPIDFEKIDLILKQIGSNHALECYRHSHCSVQGVIVENHYYLTDARWVKKWGLLEKRLKDDANKILESSKQLGLLYPDDLFAIVFFLYHTLAHLVYEHITVRFLLDWYYLLKNKKEINVNELEKVLKEYDLLKIAAVLTKLCIERLNMKEEHIPAFILIEVKTIDESLICFVEKDMFDSKHKGFTSDSLKDRIERLFSFYHNRWKIKEFLNLSYYSFVFQKTWAIVRWK